VCVAHRLPLCSPMCVAHPPPPLSFGYFSFPVSPVTDNCPDYHTVIPLARCMDMWTIESLIRANTLRSLDDLEDYINQIANNAFEYNVDEEHEVHREAVRLVEVAAQGVGSARGRYRKMFYPLEWAKENPNEHAKERLAKEKKKGKKISSNLSDDYDGYYDDSNGVEHDRPSRSRSKITYNESDNAFWDRMGSKVTESGMSSEGRRAVRDNERLAEVQRNKGQRGKKSMGESTSSSVTYVYSDRDAGKSRHAVELSGS